MDCVIPGHSVRTLSAAVASLSRVGKEVYLEFDPIDGLRLRSLNDSKSAYASFHFEPCFFERCSSLPRPRQKQNAKQRRSNNKRRRDVDEDDDPLEDDEEEPLVCRIAVRALAAVVRPRKHVLSLAVTIPHPPLDNSKHQMDDDHDIRWTMQFAFSLQYQSTDGSGGSCLLSVTHRVPLAEAESLSAVCDSENSSLVTVPSPKVLLRALQPLHNNREAALTVGRESGTFTFSSFLQSSASMGENPLNNSTLSGTASRLQTETGLAAHDLELDYPERSQQQQNDNNDDMPKDIDERVTLVFSLKECKALLTFAAKQEDSVMSNDVTLQFHWGGKPLVLETRTSAYRAQVVLATLDHKLLMANQ